MTHFRPIATTVFSCALFVLLQSSESVHAQTIIDWNGSSSNSYNNIFNWTPLDVPNDISESARFNILGSFDVTLSSGTTTTVSDLIINQGDINFAANALVFATYTTDDDVRVDGGDFSLSRSGGNGDLRLNVGDDLFVGNGSSFLVELGSDVTVNDDTNIGPNAGSTGLATIDGNGSTWMIAADLLVGFLGDGTLTITGGGSVTSATGDLGLATGGVGKAVIDGVGSTWTSNGYLRVGSGGTGTLNITGGGVVSSDSSVVGQGAGRGSVLVDGEGSLWTMPGEFDVDGTVRIAGGGKVIVGTSAHGDGRILLDGGTLSVGSIGNLLDWRSGTLVLTRVSGLDIGSSGFSLLGASVALDEDQHLEVTNTLTIKNDGVLFTAGNLSTGHLINDGDLVLSSTVVDGPVTNNANITAIGGVTFNDQVDGPGSYFGPGNITFSGGMVPGASPSEVAFEGDVTFGDNNTLFIELAGTTPGSEYDALDIVGSADLGGTLDVSLIDSFLPNIGDSFEIINAGSVMNSFDIENLPDIGPLLWNVNYSSNNVMLEVVSPFTADFDQDGDVDGRDFLIWQRGGSPNPLSSSDLALWKAQYGSALPLSANANVVPEPNTAAIVFCLIMIAGYRRSFCS